MTLCHEEYKLSTLPTGCHPTILGDLMGADQQFRCPGGIHIRRYGNRLVAHRDSIDPREDLIGHLLVDAPVKTAITVGVSAAAFATLTGRAESAPAAGLALGLGTLLLASLITMGHTSRSVRVVYT